VTVLVKGFRILKQIVHRASEAGVSGVAYPVVSVTAGRIIVNRNNAVNITGALPPCCS